MNFLTNLGKRNKLSLLLVGFVLIGVIGILDFLTGYEFAFSVFYILPIAWITWFTGRRLGLVASLLSACVWLGADLTSGHSYSNPIITIWNTFIRFAFFVIVTLLLSELRKVIAREGELARVDLLTGAVNSRFFYELAQKEIDRFERYKHPFTLAYIDLDNFKIANDQFGRTMGDQVLRTVVSSTKKCIRRTDMIARLGGDEFVLLLLETPPESAQAGITKVHDKLLEEMQQHNWPITFSVGVLTCIATPHTVDELVSMAEKLMYQVKHDDKNAILYSIFEG